MDYSKQHIGLQPLSEIFLHTYGVIFLGTPHRGSSAASLGVMAARMAKFAFVDSSNILLKSLRKKSEVLERISESFGRIMFLKEVVVHSFYETLPTKGIGLVSCHLFLSRPQRSFSNLRLFRLSSRILQQLDMPMRNSAQYGDLIETCVGFTITRTAVINIY